METGQGWVASVDGAVASWLEYLEESDPDYRHIGLDIFLTTGLHRTRYAAVVFKPVGAMRQYEGGPDGSWHDGLLMDLLAEEFAHPRGSSPRARAEPRTRSSAMA